MRARPATDDMLTLGMAMRMTSVHRVPQLFNILRSETRNGEYTKLNEQLILGQGTTSERTAYEWKDTTAKPNVVYYYQIQDVSLDGDVQTLRQSRLKGNVTAAGKLTTTWGELKTLRE